MRCRASERRGTSSARRPPASGAAGRAKDLEDVRGVLKERLTELDLDSIRSTLALLEDALGQSDLRPLFERELGMAGGARAAPESDDEHETRRVTVKFEDLELAFGFVSSGAPMEHAAYVSLDTGTVYWDTEDEELPDDVDESDRYVAVPHKNDLDLGRRLVMRFAERELWHRYSEIEDCFRRRGACGRFKRILDAEKRLDAWYVFEADATERALRDWCADNDIGVTGRKP